MAGGEGSRLRPITANRPKPLVPVGNLPIMEHILGLLRRHGIHEVVCTLHYLADEIQSYFDDGSDLGVDLTYSIEDSPLGTAGSVKKAEELLRDGTFIIVSGDALTDCDLTKAIEFHRKMGSIATLILSRVPNPLEFGVVITDNDGRIERFLEKPSWSEVFSDTVNTGMYILEPEIFDFMEPGKPYDWSQDIFPELLQQNKPMYGYVMEDYWCDVGTLGQYREAQEHLLGGRTSLPVPGTQIQPGVWIGSNCMVDDLATLIPPVCIGRNTKIKGNAQIGPYTVIGDNCLVEDGARIERSVIWESSYVGPNVGIHSAIVGTRVTIKRDTVIREDAVIGDRCLIDTNCTIRPRIKLWPDKVIERGSTVTMSLVWGNKWRGNLFRELGVAGLSNIEITPEFATRLGSAFGSIVPDGATIVTARDSTRSSRMIKRALMASLLSVGCEVLDMRSTAVPIARHFIRASGAAGAMNVRKLPGNRRVTLIEIFDERGAYLSKPQERKVETAFFREDFHRTDPDDLGQIEDASRAIEAYQADFFRLLGSPPTSKRMRIVCDFGFSSISSIFPSMLGRLGVEAISINGYNDAKLSPRSTPEVQRHIDNLRQIVGTLGYEMGALFTNEGERLTLVDSRGRVVEGNDLLAVLCTLVARSRETASIGLSVTAPSRLEELLRGQGVEVIRTKADTRSLMASSSNAGVGFAGDEQGGFIFPEFHPGFDAMFALANLIAMLQRTDTSLLDLTETLPEFSVAYEQVRCPWEAKGTVMRRITEEHRENARVELIDGIKIYTGNEWVLVRPDAVEPVFHIYAESEDAENSRRLVGDYARHIENLLATT